MRQIGRRWSANARICVELIRLRVPFYCLKWLEFSYVSKFVTESPADKLPVQLFREIDLEECNIDISARWTVFLSCRYKPTLDKTNTPFNGSQDNALFRSH